MDSKRAKILVVDDNPRVRSFLRPALEGAGFDCVEAEDGWTALVMVKEECPDFSPIYPKGLATPADFPNLTGALLERDYSEPDVQKILGKNFLRLFAEVWE